MDEQPEANSSMSAVIGLIIFITTGAFLFFGTFFKVSQVDSSLSRMIGIDLVGGNAGSGLFSVLLFILPVIFGLVSIFSIQKKLPGLLTDEERLQSLEKFLQSTVIPLGAVVFFALVVFQFLKSGTGTLQETGGVILVITAVISTAVVARTLIVG